MTVTVERSPLDAALTIPGARAVALLHVADGATVLWRAGDRPPDEREAAMAVTLAVAAAGLVAFADPADELGDVLVASAAAFHVLRLVGDGEQVAHLTLRRDGANLAMARQEFKLLTETYAACTGPVPSPAATPPVSAPPVSAPPVSAPPAAACPMSAPPVSAPPAWPAASPADSGPPGAGLPGAGLPGPEPGGPGTSGAGPPRPGQAGAALPRRRPNGAPVAAGVPLTAAPPATGEADEAAPGWLTMLGQPYLTDEYVLDRILVTLRDL